MSTTLQEKQLISAKYKGPRSMCTCGHAGDGSGVDKADTFNAHSGVIGHGACTVSGCACVKFTWAASLPAYTKALDTDPTVSNATAYQARKDARKANAQRGR